MAAILSRPQCVNHGKTTTTKLYAYYINTFDLVKFNAEYDKMYFSILTVHMIFTML